MYSIDQVVVSVFVALLLIGNVMVLSDAVKTYKRTKK